ncbi:MAG: hypothetical protein ACRYF0_02940 [Janthinobacterium lividum]
MGMMECPKHGPHTLGGAVDAMNRVCCPECLQEEKYYAAKSTGNDLPCIGYEHTLNWRHLTEVERLEEVLRSQYQFQKSKRPHSEGTGSLLVLPGRFTEPLTVEIYYVVLGSEQDYLLALIDKFFLESEYPQRKIIFYEAERWHEETRGNTHSYQYLEGIVIREVSVA